jgi:hypothetical protein
MLLDFEGEVEWVEILSAVSIGPPELGVGDVEGGGAGVIKGDDLLTLGLKLDLALELEVAEGAFEDSLLRGVGDVFEGSFYGDVGGIYFRQREIGGDQRIFDEDGAGGGEEDLAPDAGVAVADGGDPVPADGGEEGGAVEGGDAAVEAEAVGDGVLVRVAGVGLGGDEDEISKTPRMKAPRVVPICWPLSQISEA